MLVSRRVPIPRFFSDHWSQQRWINFFVTWGLRAEVAHQRPFCGAVDSLIRWFVSLLILPYPIGSMYGIFTYIWMIFMVNVGRYTIHGCYGIWFGSTPHVFNGHEWRFPGIPPPEDVWKILVMTWFWGPGGRISHHVLRKIIRMDLPRDLYTYDVFSTPWNSSSFNQLFEEQTWELFEALALCRRHSFWSRKVSWTFFNLEHGKALQALLWSVWFLLQQKHFLA